VCLLRCGAHAASQTYHRRAIATLCPERARCQMIFPHATTQASPLLITSKKSSPRRRRLQAPMPSPRWAVLNMMEEVATLVASSKGTNAKVDSIAIIATTSMRSCAAKGRIRETVQKLGWRNKVGWRSNESTSADKQQAGRMSHHCQPIQFVFDIVELCPMYIFWRGQFFSMYIVR